MTASIADTQGKTASSKTEMKKTANLEAQAKEATSRYGALKSTTRPGAPIAWFPPKMRNFFESHGVEKVGVKLDGSGNFKEPELADWVKDTWSMDLPSAGFDAFGKAIAELDNTEPILAVQRLSLHAVPADPQSQQASITVPTGFHAK